MLSKLLKVNFIPGIFRYCYLMWIVMVMKATCWTVKVVELVYTTVQSMNQLELSAKVNKQDLG